MGTLSSRIGARFTLIVCGLLLLLWSLNGLRIVPKFLRGVLRMLVISDNTDVYRQRALVTGISTR